VGRWFTIFLLEGDEPTPPFPYMLPSEPEHLLRLDSVMALTGLSRATIWRMERAGTFPRHQKVGKRAIRWRESEVRAFLARA
jgi:prophage regulatory protein